jgi:SHS family lactate transporter-like MFS transporter
MGGIYGNCAATALEDAPIEARGILSGMLQQGYAFGYLLATVFARGLVGTTSHGWRPLFWFGACPPLLIILFRMYLPETNSYLERQALKAERAEGVEGIERVMWKEAKIGLKKHWLLLIYMVLLMAGFNFMVIITYAQHPDELLGANIMNSPTDPKISTLPCWRTSSNSATTK